MNNNFEKINSPKFEAFKANEISNLKVVIGGADTCIGGALYSDDYTTSSPSGATTTDGGKLKLQTCQ